MPEICLIEPAAEPVDVLEAQLHANVTDGDLQLPRLTLCVMQGRNAAESKTRQQCVHARYRLILNRFPYGVGPYLAETYSIPRNAVILPHAPVAAVVSIEYQDMASAWQTMDPTTYTVDLVRKPAIITPNFGQIWPIVLPQIASVRITYDAGYASPFTAAAGVGGPLTVTGPVTWAVGALVRLSNSGGTLPAPLKVGVDYKILTAAAGVYTIGDALGTPITLSTTGTGTSYIGVIPAGLLGWILIRAASLYEHREEVAILNRGKIEELPFMEGLLDAFRVSLP